MAEITFDSANTLESRMASMTRTEVIAAAKAICAALPENGCHGAICPASVSIGEDGSAALGKPLEGEILELSAEALEFAAPELFRHAWKRSILPAFFRNYLTLQKRSRL